jgi:SET domain-containing protein
MPIEQHWVAAPETNGHRDTICPGAVYVSGSHRHGRGVFAGRCFGAGDVIEECPVLPVFEDQVEALDSTELYGYSFEWQDGVAMALGYGSLYNHSWTPNARYDHDYERSLVVYTALRTIAPDEEITVNYAGDPDGRIELWFDIKEGPSCS